LEGSNKGWQYEVIHGESNNSVSGFVVALNANLAIDEAAKHACLVYGVKRSEITDINVEALEA
jgi:hypothetical protein